VKANFAFGLMVINNRPLERHTKFRTDTDVGHEYNYKLGIKHLTC